MKKIFLLAGLISASILSLKAQTVKSDGVALSIGAGVTMPNTVMKNTYNMGNLTNFNLGVYVPLFKLGHAANLSNIGLNVGGEYFVGNKDYNTSTSPLFNIMGQQGNPTISAKGSGSPKQQGFKNEAGVQANISLGPIVLSPILNVDYLNFKQKAHSITQNSSVNGQNRDVVLYSQAASKTTGVSFNPKLRVSHRYKFGRDNRIAIFAEGNYTAGPTIQTQTNTFKPNGAEDAKGMYNIDQILSGKNIASQTSTKFNSFGVNVGISFSWMKAAMDKGRTSNPNQPQNQSIINTSKSNTKDKVVNADQLDSLSTGDPNQPQNQSIINTSKSNTKDKVANPDRIDSLPIGNPSQPQNQSIINTTKSNTKDRNVKLEEANERRTWDPLFASSAKAGNVQMMEVKYNGLEKSLGKTKLSILGSGVTLADGTPVVNGKVVSGQITGIDAASRITIKQAASGDEGSALTDRMGNFTISLGHDTLHKVYINDKEYGKIKIESTEQPDAFRKGWDGTVKGGSKIVSPNTEPNGYLKGWEGTVKGGSKIAKPNTEVNGYRKGWDGSVKGSSKAANPNTEGDAFRKGWDGTVKGGSKIANPNEEINAFVAGEPIGGIIVKGGRNPGGQMMTTTTNGNGEFGFEVKQAGDYLFSMTTSPELAENASARRAARKAAQQAKPANAEVKNPLYEGAGASGTNPIYQNFVAGEPIGGIVVKGGRNPGGSMIILNPNANGELLLKNLAPGNYKFTTTARKGWDGSVKGSSKAADRNTEANDYRKGWDGSVKGSSKNVKPNDEDNAGTQKSSTENMSPLYKGNAIYEGFVAGEPIGGIIVKGGRNPGGQMMTTNTDGSGEFSFEVKEAGDYLFSMTASPELAANANARRAARKAAVQTKPANAEVRNPLYEGSGASGTNPVYQNFVAGEPIGGIVVKGGRNPGGSMMILNPTADGELLLKNLAPGNYKFTTTARKGWDGTVKGGSKTSVPNKDKKGKAAKRSINDSKKSTLGIIR